MLVTWKYLDRNTIIQRLDPRARIVFMLCALSAAMLLWDIRWVLGVLALALIQFLLARISFRESRRFWLVIVLLATFLSVLTLLTGNRMTGYVTETHPLYVGPSFRLLFWTITPSLSAEQIVFLIAQILRILTFALLALIIPYTINPTQYGITFHGLGIPDKFAYAMDLSFRLVPTMARDLGIILDAQRARGYELDKLQGGLIEKVRKMAPFMVPLVIGAIVGGEEIAEAMDLRAFGVGPRTWQPQLHYRALDIGLIVFSVALLLGVALARLLGYGGVWVPEFLLHLAQT
ncbi:MAG TPA: energy-coupling factor transporter transmembrane component T [Anaerolineales bacterium]|nr:energy-coupling factor transporter transmembrane component T [Anaerolineales bacterium]